MNYPGILLLAVFILAICVFPCGALPGPVEKSVNAAGFELRGDSIASIVFPSGLNDTHMTEPVIFEGQITREDQHANFSQAMAPEPQDAVPLSRLPSEVA